MVSTIDNRPHSGPRRSRVCTKTTSSWRPRSMVWPQAPVSPRVHEAVGAIHGILRTAPAGPRALHHVPLDRCAPGMRGIDAQPRGRAALARRQREQSCPCGRCAACPAVGTNASPRPGRCLPGAGRKLGDAGGRDRTYRALRYAETATVNVTAKENPDAAANARIPFSAAQQFRAQHPGHRPPGTPPTAS